MREPVANRRGILAAILTLPLFRPRAPSKFMGGQALRWRGSRPSAVAGGGLAVFVGAVIREDAVIYPGRGYTHEEWARCEAHDLPLILAEQQAAMT